jgi:hypothetical protein
MPEEDLYLTIDQISANILIRLRGRFVTVDDVLELNNKLSYTDAKVIASKCNEYLLEMQRYLYSKI